MLASPSHSGSAYTYAYEGAMGIKGLPAGNYLLAWFDTVTGRTVTHDNVSFAGGDAAWEKPPGFGGELALYVKPRGR